MGDRADRVGQQIGDYRLLRRLGGGGFGNVYLGEHLHEHTQVAVKVLHARLTRHEDLKEFINEARTMRLRHPHIVSLLDFGIASDDTPFLVMTYAPYGTLRDRHPKGSRLPLSTIVSYVQELSSALQYAHSLHLVHRDVKPENMLVGPSHEVLLSDFGIVAVAHSSRSLAAEQEIGGTLPYMAPEQIAGKPRAASDQYALGIVAYEWITGMRPFTGTTVEIAVQHTTTPPPSLREQIPTLPVEVEQVVLKALAKDPKSRFADIEAFARAFEQASQQAEMPRPSPERSSSAVSPLSVRDPASAQPPTEQTSVMDSDVTDIAFTPLPAASFSGVEGVASVVQSVDYPVTTPIPSLPVSALSKQELPPPHFPHPVGTESPQGLRQRRLTRRTTVTLLLTLVLLLGSVGGLYATARLSTNRTQVTASAFPTSTAQVQVTATANAQASATASVLLTSTAQSNAEATASVQATARASAGSYAEFVASNGIMFGFDAQHTHANPYEQILTPTTVGGLTKKWAYPIGSGTDSSPSVASGVVYIGSGDGNVYALDVASGAKKWAFQTGARIDSSPAVANGVVYVGSYDHNVYALDAASGAKKWAFQTGNSIYSSPAVTNGVVYIGSEDGTLYALDAASGAKKWTFQTGNPVSGSSPAVAGGVVYMGSDGGTLYALDAASGTKKWTYQTGDIIHSSPAVADGVVYDGSYDQNLYAFHLPGT